MISGEKLHGSNGEGRHKAFSLGNRVTWQFTYRSENKVLRRFTITGKANDETPFYLSDDEEAPEKSKVGCVVTIDQPTKTLHSFLQDETRLKLSAHFLQFLIRHPRFELVWNGQNITPNDVIRTKKQLKDETYTWNGRSYVIQMEVVEWTSSKDKEILLCSTSGIPLRTVSAKDLCSIPNYSIFATSSLFDKMDEENTLPTIEATNDVEIVERVRKKAKSYFRQRYRKDSRKALRNLRQEGSYPYYVRPQTLLEKVEQKVFDACTLSIIRNMPSFQERMDADSRKLLLRMIKESLSQNPTAVGKIIREVCKLPNDDADKFADLLDNVPLNKIVQTSALISDRLCFLDLFDSVVHLNPFERQVKERTELQRILAPNTWIFGEEYTLGTDDKNLMTVLQKHIRILGRDHLHNALDDSTIRKAIVEFNSTAVGTGLSLERIPDLMLWKKYYERRPDEYEFLVVEIKRPKVKIGRKECGQIEDYAEAVTSTPFTDKKKTNWTFVIISDELDSTTEARVASNKQEPNVLLSLPEKRYVVKALSWSEVIRGARARHQFLKQSLDFALSEDQTIALAQKRFTDSLPRSNRNR